MEKVFTAQELIVLTLRHTDTEFAEIYRQYEIALTDEINIFGCDGGNFELLTIITAYIEKEIKKGQANTQRIYAYTDIIWEGKSILQKGIKYIFKNNPHSVKEFYEGTEYYDRYMEKCLLKYYHFYKTHKNK
jgi:hypothetical protein